MASYLIYQLQGAPLFAMETFLYALIGGVLPAIFWLWFWMHEANDHKEPKDIIFLSFVIGMCGVFAVYPLQKLAANLFNLKDGNLSAIYIWAIIEELNLLELGLLPLKTRWFMTIQ